MPVEKNKVLTFDDEIQKEQQDGKKTQKWIKKQQNYIHLNLYVN
jgi:hypothetical protein